MKKRYEEMYADMATSKDVAKMQTFGNAEKWAFGVIAEKQPEIARRWLDRLEAGYWHNFLSEAEASELAAKFVNQDGTKGAHWNLATFSAVVESLNAPMEVAPKFNKYALWLTANMLYSDHAKSVKKYIAEENLPTYFYEQAVESLTDIDRAHFIRPYFGLE